MERNPNGRSNEQTFADLTRKVNYLLATTNRKTNGDSLDLEEIKNQIKEIFEILDALEVNDLISRLDKTDDEIKTIKNDISTLKTQIQIIQIELQTLIEDVSKNTVVIANWEDKKLTTILDYINDNVDKLLHIMSVYDRLFDSDIQIANIMFFIDNIDKFETVLSVYDKLSAQGVSIDEFISQMEFMKSYYEIEEITKTYYDVINDMSTITPPALFEFQNNQFALFQRNYINLPESFDDVEDLTIIPLSCLQLELQRNIILNTNTGLIFSESSKNVSLTIQESGSYLTYEITISGTNIFTHTIPNFQVNGSKSITYLPNYSHHTIIFTKVEGKTEYNIHVITGTMDVNLKTINTESSRFSKTMSQDLFTMMISDIPPQSTLYASLTASIDSHELNFFRNLYLTGVLLNVAYQTELEFNDMYPNQLVNNLYGQSTAIAVSKAMKEIGATTRLRSVEYSRKQTTIATAAAYIDEVTGYITDVGSVPIGIQSTCIGPGTGIIDYFTKKNISCETLTESNGRYYANSSKEIFYASIPKIELTQSYEDEQNVVECWFEEEWMLPKVTASSDATSIFINAKNELTIRESSIGVGLQKGSSENQKFLVAGLQVAVAGSDLSDNEYWGTSKTYTITTLPSIVMYIKLPNVSLDSTNKVSGSVSINGTSYSVIMTPTMYDVGSSAFKVYKGVVTTLPSTTRTLKTFGGFPFRKNIKERWVRINQTYDDTPIFEKESNLQYLAPITITNTPTLYTPQPVCIHTSIRSGWAQRQSDVTAPIGPQAFSKGYSTISEYMSPPNVLARNVKAADVYTCLYLENQYQVEGGPGDSFFSIPKSEISGTGVIDGNIEFQMMSLVSGRWTSQSYIKNCYGLEGIILIRPPNKRAVATNNEIQVSNISLSGEEITTPVQFNQLTIPDYILKLQYDVAYLSAYAEYLTALIDQLDKRVSLVEDTLDQVIESINQIVNALNPSSKSIGGQILGFIGTSVGMFFPLTGLAVSIIGQIYDGVVELKKGNLLVGIMDIVTGGIMSVLGIRKYRQRMERKYGAVEIKQDPRLPTYDELFGPPGYGASNVKINYYVGKKSESKRIQGGTLRNTIIFNDKPGQFMLHTWLYRTNYGFQSDVRAVDRPIYRLFRAREHWASSEKVTMTYDYMQLELVDGKIVTSNATQEQFESDFNSTFTINQFGKLLFAKTSNSIERSEGVGYDQEVFETFALLTSPKTAGQLSRFRLRNQFPRYTIVHDKLAREFNIRQVSPNSNTLMTIEDLHQSLDPDLSSNESQSKLFDGVYNMLNASITV